MTELTHINHQGEAHMVDVGNKAETQRSATAIGFVYMQPDTLSLIQQGEHKKGDVFAVARIAGIQGAKKTPDLIPLCHPLMLTSINIDIEAQPEHDRVQITATCKLCGQTGVEMEALTAVSTAALTIYDMCKAADKRMTIQGIQVLEKQGGKSGDWHIEPAPQV